MEIKATNNETCSEFVCEPTSGTYKGHPYEENYIDKEGFTCIHHAVQNGFLETLKTLSLKNIDVNIKTNSGLTPLHLSVKNRNLEIAKYLIGNKADLNCIDNTGRTCLHYVTANEDENLINFLCQNNADINAKDVKGKTSLHISIERGNLAVVRLLIANNADPKSADNDGDTCMHYAAIKGVDIIKYFIPFFKDLNVKNYYGVTPLQVAAQFGKLEAIKYLVSQKADPKTLDKYGGTCLHYASARGGVNTIEYFIQHNNVNVKDKFMKTPLHYAAQYGKLDGVKFLINKQADPKSLDIDLSTCLHYASIGGDINNIEYFIQYNSVNVIDRFGKTPLHYAAEAGNVDAIKFLICKDADPKIVDNKGKNCIHYAATGGHVNTIEYFIQQDDVNVKDKLMKTPLHYAIENGKFKAIKFLISQQADPQTIERSRGNTCLHLASIRGDIKIIEYFIKYINVNVKNRLEQTPLCLAAGKGNLEAIKFLISKEADPKIVDNIRATNLHEACIAGDIHTIEYLLEHHNINVKDNADRTPLHHTAQFGKLNTAKLLICKGAEPKDVDCGGVTCLHYAVRARNMNMIEYFIQYVDVNVKDHRGKTPLHWAAEAGNLDAIKFLITKNADPNCRGKNGKTCLHYASSGGNINTIEYFIQYLSVNVKNDFGNAPLYYATKYGNLEAIKFLINKGADPNLSFIDGNTCLHLASIKGNISIIEYFLQYISVNAKNPVYITPLHFAAQSRNFEAVKFLISKGADHKCLDLDEATCLHYAAKGGDINIIEYFLQYHDVNVRDRFGRTPLHKTINLETEQFLFRKGATMNCLRTPVMEVEEL